MSNPLATAKSAAMYMCVITACLAIASGVALSVISGRDWVMIWRVTGGVSLVSVVASIAFYFGAAWARRFLTGLYVLAGLAAVGGMVWFVIQWNLGALFWLLVLCVLCFTGAGALTSAQARWHCGEARPPS